MRPEKILAVAAGLVATHVAIEHREQVADWVSRLNPSLGHHVRLALDLGAEAEHAAVGIAEGFFEQELGARRPNAQTAHRVPVEQ